MAVLCFLDLEGSVGSPYDTSSIFSTQSRPGTQVARYSTDLWGRKKWQEHRYLMILGQLRRNADLDTRSWLMDLRFEAPGPRNSVLRDV